MNRRTLYTICVRLWIKNLPTHAQTFFQRICLPECERENQSDPKTFQIRHETGKNPSSVNIVLLIPAVVQFASSLSANLKHCKVQKPLYQKGPI